MSNKIEAIKDYKTLNKGVLFVEENYKKVLQIHNNDMILKNLVKKDNISKPFDGYSKKPISSAVRSNELSEVKSKTEFELKRKEESQVINLKLPSIYGNLRTGIIYPKEMKCSITKVKKNKKTNSLNSCGQRYHKFLCFLEVIFILILLET